MLGAPDISAQIATAQAATTPRPMAASAGGSRKAAEDFAAFFFTQSLESVFANMDADKLFGGGNGENVYRSLMLQEYGKVAAKGGGMGIADAVQREILRLQEKQ
jgi:flagellar protein FlgJ